MKDFFEIIKRLPWLWSKYPATPKPWARCHCGALADFDMRPGLWCSPCKFSGHDTCECSGN